MTLYKDRRDAVLFAVQNGKTRGLSVREQKTLDTILRAWDTKDSKN
nr:MAG TPA: hypothetical protein [Caudoviricetes sp.]